MALLLLPSTGYPETLQALLQQEQLRMRSWLAPAQDIVVGQEVQLIIEISTPRWFAGGTRIQIPEVANLVILRRNEFAVNSSRREDAATWVVQQWQLELYPQQEGDFVVPPIELELAVNVASAGIVRGSLQTDALGFRVTVPPQLADADKWLATPTLEAEQTFSRTLAGLVPGDAFEREITVRATRVTAMMLPQPHTENMEGLAAYPDNPVLEDRSNRGEATAIRRERITYVVEQEGQYQLPEQSFLWWDTSTATVQTAVLPAVDIDAGTAASPLIDDSSLAWLTINWRTLLALVLGLAALAVLLVLVRYRMKSRSPSGSQLLRLSNRALRKNNPQLAAKYLYSWLNQQSAELNWLSLRQAALSAHDDALSSSVDELLRTAFAADASAETSPKGLPSRLAAAVRRNLRPHLLQKWTPPPVALELNPTDQPRK